MSSLVVELLLVGVGTISVILVKVLEMKILHVCVLWKITKTVLETVYLLALKEQRYFS